MKVTTGFLLPVAFFGLGSLAQDQAESTPASTTSSADAEASVTEAQTGDPSNMPEIDGYVFGGCYSSDAGFPGFERISTDDDDCDITPSFCIELAKGRKFVGIAENDCYAADALEDVTQVGTEQCNAVCPSDPTAFCGGTFDAQENRRDVAISSRALPANVLLSIFSLIGQPTTTTTTATVATTATTANAGEPAGGEITTVTDTVTDPGRTISLTETVAAPDATETEMVTKTQNQIITTVTYTTINAGGLIITEYCATLNYRPCPVCPKPTVEMTTIISSCNACGRNGENEVELVVPCDAVATVTLAHGGPLETNGGRPGAQPAEMPTRANGAYGAPVQTASNGGEGQGTTEGGETSSSSQQGGQGGQGGASSSYEQGKVSSQQQGGAPTNGQGETPYSPHSQGEASGESPPPGANSKVEIGSLGESDSDIPVGVVPGGGFPMQEPASGESSGSHPEEPSGGFPVQGEASDESAFVSGACGRDVDNVYFVLLSMVLAAFAL